MINKRYKDIFDQFVYNGQKTPFTLGVIAVCIFCFVVLIVSVFSQINFYHPWLEFNPNTGFGVTIKEISYCPIIPALFFIIYILGRNYSIVVFLIYCLVGFFIFPVFAFGGGIDYIKDYFFGYLLGYLFAILTAGKLIDSDNSIKARMIAILYGILSINICGFIYCLFLAFLGIIDFSFIFPIAYAFSIEKIGYDIVFSIIVLLIAPYIKNVFWICMQRAFNKKELKYTDKRSQVFSDDVN